MLELKAERFIRAVKWLTVIERNQTLYEEGPEFDGLLESVSDRLSVLASAREVQADIASLFAPVSVIAMGDLIASLESADCTIRHITAHAQDVGRTLKRELATVNFYLVSPDRVKYLAIAKEGSLLFGPEVEFRLSSAVTDIEEAGNCLALARGTAAVFHLMRVMEAGFKELARLLEIPYAPSWESYVTQIKSKIEAKHSTKAVDWKTDEPFFRDVLGDLQAVKMAWRNPTMHIVNHFTPDQADDIFRAVRSFTQRIASRLPVSVFE
jgi:hypothetical protein